MEIFNHVRASRVGVSAAALAGFAVLAPGLGVAQAGASGGHGAVVVQQVNRSPIGNMLATTSGASLYTHPGGPCNKSCQQIWPRLLMPSGKTKPKGADCLSTLTTAKGLQVTYHNEALYTFTGDSGSSENGNGVGGFVAAKIKKSCP